MSQTIVVMGVAGSGKSSLATLLAETLGVDMIDADDFHSTQSRLKMASGQPLTDDDRKPWLHELALQLQARPTGVVLACSALKKSYRDQLRMSAANLRFVFLAIDMAEAKRRLLARSSEHFFSAALIESQLATLEAPLGEPGVLHLDAVLPATQACTQVRQWLLEG